MSGEPTPVPPGDWLPDHLMPLEDLEGTAEGDVVVRDDRVYLKGARSASSGVETFPARPICPETGARDMEPALFGPDAVLYSFSTVHVSATRPVPFTLGYIDFPSGLRAFAHVRAGKRSLRCDIPVTLRAEGTTWWVEPAEATS